MSDIALLRELRDGAKYLHNFYREVLDNELSERDRPLLEAAAQHHLDHSTHLAELLANRSAESSETMNSPPAHDHNAWSEDAIALESAAAQVALGVVPKLEDRHLSTVAAQIAAIRAMHWSALLGLRDELAAPVSFIRARI